jgi:hypothetical protein
MTDKPVALMSRDEAKRAGTAVFAEWRILDLNVWSMLEPTDEFAADFERIREGAA